MNPIVDCDEWLRFIEHELQNGLRVFPLSVDELWKLVNGWRAIKGVDVAALERRLDAVKKALG